MPASVATPPAVNNAPAPVLSGQQAQDYFNNLTTPASSPTVISTNTGANIVQEKQQKIQQMGGTPLINTTQDRIFNPKTGNMDVNPNYVSMTGNGVGTASALPKNAQTDPNNPSGATSKTQQETQTANTPSATFLNPTTGQSATLSGASLTASQVKDLTANGYQVSEQNGAIPSYVLQGNTDEELAQNALTQATTDKNNLISKLSQFTVSDSALAAQIATITNQWNAREADMQTINTQRATALNTTGIRLGSQYSGGSGGAFGGIVSEEERQGVERIAGLEADKQTAITAAQTAARDQNWKVFSEQMNLAESDYKDKLTAVQDLQKASLAQNQKIQDQKDQATKDSAVASIFAKGITDPATILSQLKAAGNNTLTLADVSASLKSLQPDIAEIQSLVKAAADNGADPAILQAIARSKNTAEAITVAGDSLNGMLNATGQVGDYARYQRDAKANGLTPMDYPTWKAKDDLAVAALKSKEAYGTAFSTAKGKAAGEASGRGPVITSAVTDNKIGVTYQAPASIAPYVAFANNGVRYVDLSNFKGTPTEANQAVNDAQRAGYKVITNKNTAIDIQNIADANAKLADMKDAFDGITSDSATKRDLYGAALVTMAKALQTDPNASASDVYQIAALDILKAVSGTQGFRGGASMVQSVERIFPKNTDTTPTADQKIANIVKLLDDRETILVGKPDASTQAIIDGKKQQDSVINYVKTNPDQAEKVAGLAGQKKADGTIWTPQDVYDYLKQAGKVK